MDSRIPRMVKMRMDHKSYREIGGVFGISRERVRQLLEREAGSYVGRKYSPRVRRIIKICRNDGKKFLVPLSQLGRKFCSVPCSIKYKEKHSPYRGLKKYSPEYHHAQYERLKREDPKRLALYHFTAYQIFKRRIKTDPKYRARFNKYQREYAHAHRDRINARKRAKYVSDPKYQERLLESSRLYYRKNRKLILKRQKTKRAVDNRT